MLRYETSKFCSNNIGKKYKKYWIIPYARVKEGFEMMTSPLISMDRADTDYRTLAVNVLDMMQYSTNAEILPYKETERRFEEYLVATTKWKSFNALWCNKIVFGGLRLMDSKIIIDITITSGKDRGKPRMKKELPSDASIDEIAAVFEEMVESELELKGIKM